VNWADFFAMGGYALYVWGSYGLAAVILILNVVQPWRRAKLVREQLRDFYRLKGQSQ
jgi:heme exporter protein D